MLSASDNNIEIAYADVNGIAYKRYHEFLGQLCVILSAHGGGRCTEDINDGYVKTRFVKHYTGYQLSD